MKFKNYDKLPKRYAITSEEYQIIILALAAYDEQLWSSIQKLDSMDNLNTSTKETEKTYLMKRSKTATNLIFDLCNRAE